MSLILRNGAVHITSHIPLEVQVALPPSLGEGHGVPQPRRHPMAGSLI
jgi:hypothetical protein